MDPRPPSVRRSRHNPNRHTQSAVSRSGGVHPQGRFVNKKPETKKPEAAQPVRADPTPKVRLSPSEVVSKAAAKVSRLEAALAALEDTDDADGPEATALKEALKKARAQATPANPGRRLDECQQYVERARRRLEKAQEAVVEAQRLVQITKSSWMPVWPISKHFGGKQGCRLGNPRNLGTRQSWRIFADRCNS